MAQRNQVARRVELALMILMKAYKEIFMRMLTILLASFFMVACSKAPYAKIPPTGTILAFGDSLTYGYNVQPEHSYPSVLARLSGRNVVNAGVSGEVTADGLVRLTELFNDNHYDFLILLEGGNDILQNLSQAQLQSNLSHMIELAKERNVPVLLLAVPTKNLLAPPAPFYQELADTHDVPLMNNLISRLMKQSKYKLDTVHFNEAGYEEMANEIYREMKKLGAL